MMLEPSRSQWLRKCSTLFFSWSLAQQMCELLSILTLKMLLCLSSKGNSTSFPRDVDPRGLWSRWHITSLERFSSRQQPALPVVRGSTLFFVNKKNLGILRDPWPIKLFANKTPFQTNVKIWFPSLTGMMGISHFLWDTLSSNSSVPLCLGSGFISSLKCLFLTCACLFVLLYFSKHLFPII